MKGIWFIHILINVQARKEHTLTRSWVYSCAVCNPVDCGLLGPSVHGITQARILEWVAIPSPGDLTDLETEPQTPTLHAEDLLNQKKLKRKRSCRLDLLIREG